MLQLPKLADRKILVVGDIMLDRYWHGRTQRISPEAPVPVVHVQRMEDRIGGAANVANNLKALGVDTHLQGLVGDDDSGEEIVEQLEKLGIHATLAMCEETPTISKVRVMSRHQQLLRMDIEQQFSKDYLEQTLESFSEILPVVDLVVLSDYAKGTLADPIRFIRLAKAHDKKVIVDPKHSDMSIYAGADLVTPNWQEFTAMVGSVESEQEFIRKARELMNEHQLGALLVTRGSDGMTLVEQDNVAHLDATSGEVFDVTGAGDTVISTIAAFWAAEYSLAEAMRLANYAAGIAVSKVGTSTVSIDELHDRIMRTAELPLGVKDEATLQQLIQNAQTLGEKVVFTNGCYDVLHHGHIRYLERAKAFGQRLVVGVNTDESVRRSKGERRPFTPLAERMEVLASLKAVDWVVAFDDDTPGRLIESLNPDALVKVKEKFHSIEDIPPTEGAHYVVENGGQVHFLDRTPDCSSSDLINTLHMEES